MKQYLDILKDILENGVETPDRTGTGVKSVFARQMRFNLKDGFPLLTTKKVFWKGIVQELLWIISGSTNEHDLSKTGVTIWEEWADPQTGELGPVYGCQWRHAKGPDGTFVDQLSNVIEEIKTNPFSRRLIVDCWNPIDIPNMALPPCHMMFQFYVAPDEQGNPRYLDLQLYARSQDWFLGTPFNIASYALLLMMVAQVTGLEAREYVHTTGHTHLYSNHYEVAKIQLEREPKKLPSVILNPAIKNIDDFRFEDITLLDYQYHPKLTAQVSV